MMQGCVPIPEEYARRYRENGYWEDITIPQFFHGLAASAQERLAVIEGEQRMTWGGLWERVRWMSAHFHRLGLGGQQRVVFQMPNSIDFLVVFLALIRVGAIPVMALYAHRENEIGHFTRSASASALVVPDRTKDFDFREMAEAIRGQVDSVKHVLVMGEALAGQISLSELMAIEPLAADMAAADAITLDPCEVALMLLSGGTTALSKLIPRTHNDYLFNFKQAGRLAGFCPDTVLLAILPMAHNYMLGSPGVLGALAHGGRVVVSPKGDVDTVFSLVQREKITCIPAAVPLVVNWLNNPNLGDYDTSSVKLVQSGGARLSPELRDRIRKKLGCQYQEIYGTAEGLLSFTRLDDPDHLVLETSGAPMCEDDEIKVLDNDDKDVPDGQPGELVVRGPYTIRGYYNLPEKDREAFTRDGFYRMGDIVRKQGRYVSTEGRKKDLINRGGEKISADEVEDLIIQHPAVKGVMVVAMPDPVYGEKACACVTLVPKGRLTLDEIKEFLLAKKIAKFKLPERLEILEEFPLSPAGKILRRKLRENIEAMVAMEQGKIQ